MKIFSYCTLFILVFNLSSCSMPSKRSAGFQLRLPEERTLGNGLRVLFLKDDRLPKVSLLLMVKSGFAHDPEGQEGAMALTAGLLDQGTKKKTATQIADQFAQMGTSFNKSVASDYTLFSISGLSTSRNEMAELFTEVILEPSFQNKEIKRMKSQYVANLKQIQDQPAAYTELLFDQQIFGTHPYGRISLGSEKSLNSISRDQIVRHFQSHIRPQNSILVVTGQFDQSYKDQIENLFMNWKSKDYQKPPMIEVKTENNQVVKVVSKTGLQQSQIRIGHPSIPRNHPDFLKLRIANMVLGGAFASRLNQKVRDDLGLTYSVSSRFDTFKESGAFKISTFTRFEKTKQTVDETISVFKEFVEKGITKNELESAKSVLIGQFPAAIETSDRLGTNLLLLRLNGVSDSYLSDFIVNVESLNLNEVNQAIKKHLMPNKLSILVYTDREQIKGQY